MKYLLFTTAFSLSSIAGFYAVVGLMTIFSASPIPVAIMGTVLELAKIVTVSWLHRNWNTTSIGLKTYFSFAIAVLMLLTSTGIFGYLSKAHSDQSLVSGDVLAKIQIYDDKIKIAKENIEADRKVLKQFDEAVDQIMARSDSQQGAERAVAVRKSQAKDRTRLTSQIEENQKAITKLNEEAAPIRAEIRKVEAEVGPLKYIAALVYGDQIDNNVLEKAVRLVIILIIAVFDPLAVLLFVAFNKSIQSSDRVETKTEEENPKINSPTEWPELVPDIPVTSNSEINYTESQEVSKSKVRKVKKKKDLDNGDTIQLESSTKIYDSMSMVKKNTETGETLSFRF